MPPLQYLSLRHFSCFFFLLTLFVSVSSYAQLPYIVSATVQVSSPLENGAKVSYGGSDVWVSFVVEAAGNDTSQFKFQLWEQYNNGSWQFVGTFQGERQVWDWFTRRPKPVKAGTYKYKISVNKSYYTWSTPVESDVVTIRDPRKAPTAAFSYFQIYDVWGYIPAKVLEETSSRYIFHKDDASILFTWSYIVNDDPYASDLYYEFMSRKVGSDTWKISKVNGWTTNTFQWTAFEQGMQGIGLNDLETYEFAVRACNPYGCNSAKSLSKPILLDYPELNTAITSTVLGFDAFDMAASKIKRENYCFADPITKKCKGDFFKGFRFVKCTRVS